MGVKYNILNFKKDDFQTIRGFVAIFDILGYSSWIKESDLFEVVSNHKNMAKMLKTNIEGFVNEIARKDIIRVHSYADTFLIYTNEISDLGFNALLRACYFTFVAAISYNVPIRGATACGEFYISGDSILNSIIGKPIIEAYEKEKEQDWIGCWITNECLTEISKELCKKVIKRREVIKYPIPFKEGSVKEVYAYNWIRSIFNDKINLNYLETNSFLQKRKSPKWCDERKIKNTKEFINYIKPA